MSTPEMPIDRDEFKDAIDRLYHGIEGVHTRLDTLNGRTRTTEIDIATIKAKFVAYTTAAGTAMGGLTWVLDKWLR